jgi:hypothetical protein
MLISMHLRVSLVSAMKHFHCETVEVDIGKE